MAKIDTSLIAGYAEMSAEDKLKALEGYDLPAPDYTGYVKKEVADKYAHEAADFKKKYKEQLSDEQKREQERNDTFEQMKAELEVLKAEKQTNEHIQNLIELGYDKEAANKVAKATVEGDFKTVYELQSKFIDSTKKAVESDVLKRTPAPNTGDEGNQGITVEAFKKMSLKEKQELKDTDPDTFNELLKK